MPLDGTPRGNQQQEAFARAVLWREDRIPEGLAGPHGPASARRFGVYRNNIATSLSRCLAARFPVVERLVGAEFFAAMARVFIEARPPVSAALIDYGDDFGDFLAAFPPAAALAYLPDVARLEWLMGKAYHAADARPVDAAQLAALSEDALGARLKLHPSLAIHISRYRVFSIWATNARDEVVQAIDASAEGEAVLIVRPRFEVGVRKIDTATYAFIAALAAGHTLEIAAELAHELDATFDVGAALQLLFASGAVIDVHAARCSQNPQPEPVRMSCAT